MRRVLVIGGGTHGLAAAARLSRAGASVTLLERRSSFGGSSAREEFHPGFSSPGFLHTARVPRALLDALDLGPHLQSSVQDGACVPGRIALETDGPGVALFDDAARTAEALAPRSQRDAEGYTRWSEFQDRVGPFVTRTMTAPPPDLDPSGGRQMFDLFRTGAALRRLGEGDMLELMRIGPMAAADWVAEAFETPLVQAGLVAPALVGTWLGPWSAGSAAALLFSRATASVPLPGGAAALASALEAAARAAGATLAAEAEVAELLVEDGIARGVRLANGESLEADAVLSTLEPKRTLIGLVPRLALPPELEDAIRSWRTRGTTAKLHLALERLPDSVNERIVAHGLARATTGETIDDLERAFDAVKYDELSKRPVLDLYLPTLEDESFAPSGSHVLSVLAHHAPHSLRGGWTPESRAELERRVLDELEAVLPGVRERTIGSELSTPVDIEERFDAPGGHPFHGEFALDQALFLRPSLDCAHYATPIAGLFLGGKGSHPGGTLPAMAGVLAAQRALGRRG